MSDHSKRSPEQTGAQASGDETDTSLPPNNDQVVSESGRTSSDFPQQWIEHKCIFCGQDLKDLHEPKLLQCLHTACSNCLQSESSQNDPSTSTDLGGFRRGKRTRSGHKQLQCPVCNQDIVVTDAIDHLFLLEHLTQSSDNVPEESKSYPCTSCEEGLDASGFCQDCQEWLCDTCISAHHRVRVTKDHIIRPKEEMDGEKPLSGLSQKYLFCQTHVQEQLKLYCETCEKLTCRDCQLSDHKEHKYQFLSKACEEEKNFIQSLLGKIKDKQQHIENACNLVNKRHGEITEREQAVTQEIKTFAVKYISEINKRGKQLLQDLADVCTNKKTQLSYKHNELINVGQRLEYCLKFAEAALNEGSETALVYSKKIITNQLKRVLRHRCEVPNPQHTVDISFSYEANYLTQYISHHGTLLVDQHPVPQPTANTPLPNQNTTMAVQVHQNHQQQQQQQPQQQHQQQQQQQQQHHQQQQQQFQQRSQMQQMQQNAVRQNQLQSVMQRSNQQQMIAMSQRNNQAAMTQQLTPVKQMQPLQKQHPAQPSHYGQPQVTSSTDHAQGNTVRQMLNANQQMQTYSRNQVQRSANMNQARNANYNNAAFLQQSPQQPQRALVAQQVRPLQQQRQIQQAPQQLPLQQQQQCQPVALPVLNNSNITISAIPGPTPPKQRAVVPRQNVQLSPIANNQQSGRSLQRTNSQNAIGASPQVIVLDNDGPNKHSKTPTMSTTSRLSHFPAAAAALMSANPGLQIQPLNLPNNATVNTLIIPTVQMETRPAIQDFTSNLQTTTVNTLIIPTAQMGTIPTIQDFTSNFQTTTSNSIMIPVLESPSNARFTTELQALIANMDTTHVIAQTHFPSSELKKHLTMPPPTSQNEKRNIELNSNTITNISPSVISEELSSRSVLPNVGYEKVESAIPSSVQLSNEEVSKNLFDLDSSTTSSISDVTKKSSKTESNLRVADSTVSPQHPGSMEDMHLQDSNITESLKELSSRRILSSQDVDDEVSTSSEELPSLENIFQKKTLTESKSIADVIEEVVAARTSPEGNPTSKSNIKSTSPRQINKLDKADEGQTDEEENKFSKTEDDDSRMDESDDYCAVCDDGGHLFCCSKCPRVFHKFCHIPSLPNEPSDDWACLLCEDIINSADFSDLMLSRKRSASSSRRLPTSLIGYDLKACQRILLELFCNKNSSNFHYKVDKKYAPDYYEVITKPMDLGTAGTRYFYEAKEFEKYFEILLQTYFPQCAKMTEP